MLTIKFIVGISDLDNTLHLLDEEKISLDLTNVWKTLYDSLDGQLDYEFDTGITITSGEKKVEIGDYFQNLLLKLCIYVPTKLVNNEVGIFPATDSSALIFFERKGDEVFTTSNLSSDYFDGVFPYSDLVVELFSCGKRMLHFYTTFCQLAGVDEFLYTKMYRQELTKLQQALQELGIID